MTRELRQDKNGIKSELQLARDRESELLRALQTEQGRWDEFNVRSWGDVLISNPTNYVDKNITEIRMKLAENGNGGGTANVTRADISLVVEP